MNMKQTFVPMLHKVTVVHLKLISVGGGGEGGSYHGVLIPTYPKGGKG